MCETVVLMFTRATQIKTYSWGNAQVVLVANKVDLEEDRQVPTEDGQRLATELGQRRTHANTHIVFLFFNHIFDKNGREMKADLAQLPRQMQYFL